MQRVQERNPHVGLVCNLFLSSLIESFLHFREHEKFKMEAEDLMMRTKEIQMLHVTKELQQVSYCTTNSFLFHYSQ